MNDNDSFDIKQACYAAYPIKRWVWNLRDIIIRVRNIILNI